MEDIHIVTVATHDKFYLPYLKESCAKNGKKLVMLGYGKKWSGYTMRFNLIINYLQKLKLTDIVCFIDGYDVICTRNLNELKNEFIKLKKKSNSKIIVGYDNYIFYLQKIIANRYFGKCKNINLNAGTYIGYVKDLLDVISIIYTGNNTLDDQIIMTDYCNKFPNDIYIDKECDLFTTIHKPLNNIDNYFVINNNKITYKNKNPFFIHGPSCTILDNILIKLNYKINKNNKLEYQKYLFDKTIHYIKDIIKKNYLIVIICFIFVIYYKTK